MCGSSFVRWFCVTLGLIGSILLSGCTSDVKEAQFVWRDRCQNVIERGAISMIKHHDCFRACVKNYANPCRQMCENQLMQAKADRKIILTTCRIKFTRFVRRQCTLYCEMSSGQLARKIAQRRRDRILGRRHSFCDEDDNDIYAEVRPFGRVQADDDDEEQMLMDLFDKNQTDDQLLFNMFGENTKSNGRTDRSINLGDDLDSLTARDEPTMNAAPMGASVGYPQPMVMMAPQEAAAAPASSSGSNAAMNLLGQGLQSFTTLKAQQMQNQTQIQEQQMQNDTQIKEQQMQNQAQIQQQQMQLYGTPAGAAAAALSNPSTVSALQGLGSSIGSGVSSLIRH